MSKNNGRDDKRFVPDKRLYFLVGNKNYKARRDDEGYEGFGDLPAVLEDMERVKRGLLELGAHPSEIIEIFDADW